MTIHEKPVHTDGPPTTCPNCGSNEMNSHDGDGDSTAYWISWNCHSCEFGWTETYKFDNWQEDD